jgi:hypothetical protein
MLNGIVFNTSLSINQLKTCNITSECKIKYHLYYNYIIFISLLLFPKCHHHFFKKYSCGRTPQYVKISHHQHEPCYFAVNLIICTFFRSKENQLFFVSVLGTSGLQSSYLVPLNTQQQMMFGQLAVFLLSYS